MRAIFILSIFGILILPGCATIEVAKEVTKASKKLVSSKTITLSEDSLEKKISNEIELNEKISSEIELEEKISAKKKEIAIEKTKKEKIVIKQNKSATINFVGKTLDELTKQLGSPQLLREDGKSITARYDTQSCRIFVFFNASIKKYIAEYYELRNVRGELIKRQQDIKKCFKEIKLV